MHIALSFRNDPKMIAPGRRKLTVPNLLMKLRFLFIILVAGAIVSFIPDWVAAQTPTPAPKNRPQRPAPSPTVSHKPTAAPSPTKPSTSLSGPSTNTNPAKLPIVSATNAAKSSRVPKAGTKPKPLSPTQKQQVLSGQTAANPIVLDTNHLSVDADGVSASVVFRKSGVWTVNAAIGGDIAGTGLEGGVIINLASKSDGQMYLVDVSLDGIGKKSTCNGTLSGINEGK
jgi:hypothetical protein